MMTIDEINIARCLELAANGIGNVSPNPMVGCVIVHDGQIIGEGYHQVFGGPHAEVNAINSVANKELLKNATLYVNLEPCVHFGKTPPCADLIIASQIPEVVIGSADIFAAVNGMGIEKLRQHGVVVKVGILEAECLKLNRRFFNFHENKRPYIILKWAQTGDGFLAREDYSSRWISNPYSRLLVHQWRAEEDAIMIGTNTAFFDDPQLSARDMKTKNPVRILLDRGLKIPESYHIYDRTQPTIIFTNTDGKQIPGIEFIQSDFNAPDFLNNVLDDLYQKNIQSVIIEGGAKLLHSFIAKDLWDEARVFENKNIWFGKGIKAPIIDGMPSAGYKIKGDDLRYYYHG